MKIVCDACSAKYSIADDKVKGKVFKIRCKKCSNIIVVRGNAGGAEEPAAPVYDQKETRVYDYQGYDEGGAAPAAEDAVWHLVIDQEQVGPLTAGEVQAKFSSGEIDADTYIWREGFADWQPLSAVDAFAGVVAGGGGAVAAPRAEAGAGLFAGGAEEGTARSDPGDLFAAAGGAADEGADDAGSDLFGGAARGGKAAAAAPASSGDAAMFGGGAGGGADKAADKAARAAADKRLRGERNENSVLFSLNNLAALASDQPRGAPASAAQPASASQSSSGMAQQGGGEGSGLIDIRSMASTYLSDKGAAKARPSVGSIDDLPVFSTSAFSEPAVIMPSPQQSGANNKLLFALIGVVGLLAVVAVVLVVVVFTGGDKNQGQQVATGETPTAAGATPPGETPPPPAAGEPAKVEPTPSAAAPTEEPKPAPAEEPKPAEPTKVATRDEPKSSRDRDRDKKPEKKPEEKKPEPKETKPASSGSSGCLDEVGCLLADKPPACCSKYGKKSGGGGGSKSDSGGGGGGSDLPETLDRTMISSGVSKVRGRVDSCASRSSAKGEVKVQVKVAASGSVSSVSVKNTPDPSLGSCVASAMEKASFAKTQNGGTFSYPFIFR
jgi:predicted Zn finger-like uncharacterized protein